MDSDDELLLLSAITVILCAVAVKRLGRRRRRYRIKPTNRARRETSQYVYFKNIKEKDPVEFFKFTRMSVPLFNELLARIESKIRRRNVVDGISPEERLAITLQYLSHGGSMQSLAWAYQMGLSTISQILQETCFAICDALTNEYLSQPTTNDFYNIAGNFFDKWNFPNCIGAIDGMYINVQVPAHSNPQSSNHKKNDSIVLLAVCDSEHIFRLLDIGHIGLQSDSGILKSSTFGQKFEENTMPLPPPREIPNTQIKMPFMLVGNQAFPLKSYLIRPYAGQRADDLTVTQKIFNYRLARCKRVIENAFGVLVVRWRLLQQTIVATPEHVDLFVKTCVLLHNFCKINKSSGETAYCPAGFVDNGDEKNGRWRNEVITIQSIRRTGTNNATRYLFGLRDAIAQYFVTEGQLPWQLRRVAVGE